MSAFRQGFPQAQVKGCYFHLTQSIMRKAQVRVRGRRQRGRGENYGPPLFSHDVWNQHDAAGAGIARTTNTCEGWHHGVQSLMQCSHPTMWRFIEGLRRDQAVQLASFLQGAAGSQHPSERRYRVLSERVQRAIANYGKIDVLTYLRAIAHLSYS